MDLAALLGRTLKDDEMIEVLEAYDIEEVVYDFDRNAENMPDVYWASAPSSGFSLRFDERQVLDTVFCYAVADEGFAAVALDIVGAPIHHTFEDAEREARSRGLPYSTSDALEGRKPHDRWVRIEGPDQWTHYQFREGALFRITLMRPR
jgi:hypothetical protein